jgi:hypothetical protein
MVQRREDAISRGLFWGKIGPPEVILGVYLQAPFGASVDCRLAIENGAPRRHGVGAVEERPRLSHAPY